MRQFKNTTGQKITIQRHGNGGEIVFEAGETKDVLPTDIEYVAGNGSFREVPVPTPLPTKEDASKVVPIVKTEEEQVERAQEQVKSSAPADEQKAEKPEEPQQKAAGGRRH